MELKVLRDHYLKLILTKLSDFRFSSDRLARSDKNVLIVGSGKGSKANRERV